MAKTTQGAYLNQKVDLDEAEETIKNSPPKKLNRNKLDLIGQRDVDLDDDLPKKSNKNGFQLEADESEQRQKNDHKFTPAEVPQIPIDDFDISDFSEA